MIFHKKSRAFGPKDSSESHYTTYWPAASKIVESMPTVEEHHRKDERILGNKRLSLWNICHFDAHTDAITNTYLKMLETERSMTPIHLLSHEQELKGDLKKYNYEIEEWNTLINAYEGSDNDGKACKHPG